MNLNFHNTFKPESQHLTQLLLIADKCNNVSYDNLSRMTGIPQGTSSGKLKPNIEYAKYMGLIVEDEDASDRDCVTLYTTPLGKLIRDEDMGLREELTLWLLHAMISREYDRKGDSEKGGAELWYYLFHRYFKKYKVETEWNLFKNEVGTHFKTRISTIAPIRGSYEEMFSSLDLISKISKESFILKEGKYNPEFDFAYGYILFEYWDKLKQKEDMASNDEITITELEKLGFHHVFGWGIDKLNYVLERLSERELIRLNKQLMPYTILRLTTKESLLKLIYSELL